MADVLHIKPGAFYKCHSNPLPFPLPELLLCLLLLSLPNLLICFLHSALPATVLPVPFLICLMPHREAVCATCAIHATD